MTEYLKKSELAGGPSEGCNHSYLKEDGRCDACGRIIEPQMYYHIHGKGEMTEYLKKSELAGEVEKEFASVINKHSLENASNTPDFILAKFLATCLCAYNTACQDNGKWHTKDVTSAISCPEECKHEWEPVFKKAELARFDCKYCDESKPANWEGFYKQEELHEAEGDPKMETNPVLIQQTLTDYLTELLNNEATDMNEDWQEGYNEAVKHILTTVGNKK